MISVLKGVASKFQTKEVTLGALQEPLLSGEITVSEDSRQETAAKEFTTAVHSKTMLQHLFSTPAGPTQTTDELITTALKQTKFASRMKHLKKLNLKLDELTEVQKQRIVKHELDTLVNKAKPWTSNDQRYGKCHRYDSVLRAKGLVAIFQNKLVNELDDFNQKVPSMPENGAKYKDLEPIQGKIGEKNYRAEKDSLLNWIMTKEIPLTDFLNDLKTVKAIIRKLGSTSCRYGLASC